jgi:acyl phosphate:glycerol-3-phosphate acyltransferase
LRAASDFLGEGVLLQLSALVTLTDLAAFKNWVPLIDAVGLNAESAALVAFVVAYLVGSIPFGLIIGRLVGGIDIRRHGSGNIGATNVARVLGWRCGAIVLALDCLKGMLPTALLPVLLLGSQSEWHLHFAVLSGLGAITGHMYPGWLGFRGGKGVATALGVVLVLAPIVSAVTLLVFLVCIAATRIVSLSSIVAACAFCGVQMWLLRPAPFSQSTWSLAAFSLLVPLLIIARHRLNLARLMRGQEPRLTFAVKKKD